MSIRVCNLWTVICAIIMAICIPWKYHQIHLPPQSHLWGKSVRVWWRGVHWGRLTKVQAGLLPFTSSTFSHLLHMPPSCRPFLPSGSGSRNSIGGFWQKSELVLLPLLPFPSNFSLIFLQIGFPPALSRFQTVEILDGLCTFCDFSFQHIWNPEERCKYVIHHIREIFKN